MKFIFHLGTYKTGTSSLQNFLFAHRDQLAAEGICYPETGLLRSSKRLGHRHRAIIDFVNATRTTNILRDVITEAQQRNCTRVFLSSEGWADAANLPALHRIVCDLKDMGVSECEGVVAFRNIVNFQVSHYREFTLNLKSPLPYNDYAQQRPTFVNYLFLLRNYRMLFGNRLHVLQYEALKDTCTDTLEAIGLGDLARRLAPLPRSNTKSIGAFEVEAARIAYELGTDRATGFQVARALKNERRDFANAPWTERVENDLLPVGEAYRRAFQELSGWTEEATEALFTIAPITGRPVSESRGLLRHRIEAIIAARIYRKTLRGRTRTRLGNILRKLRLMR